jgi:hypothetical protein
MIFVLTIIISGIVVVRALDSKQNCFTGGDFELCKSDWECYNQCCYTGRCLPTAQHTDFACPATKPECPFMFVESDQESLKLSKQNLTITVWLVVSTVVICCLLFVFGIWLTIKL